jgi:uncharacterized protein DUF5667
MGQKIEDILDQAITQLRRGKTPAEVLLTFPEHSDELKPLLETAALGYAVPRNIVPTPLRRRAFAQTAYKSWWVRSMGLVKVGVPALTLIAMVIGGQTFVKAVDNSLPRGPLYAVKRASEQLRLKLARTPDEQASLQVELTQKRLDEVQQAAQAGPEQEAAALTELNDQTQNSFAAVSQVAVGQAIANNDPKLLNNLLAMNKQQQKVLSAIQPQPETKDIADAALVTAQENGKKLETLLVTVQEQTLADLPGKVLATGDAVVSDDKTSITINDKIFAITSATVITSASGAPMDAAHLAASVKVNIEGIQTDKGLEATTISLISSPVPPKPLESKKAEPDPAAVPNATTSSAAPAPDQNQAYARIIVDNPEPQYNP